MHVVLRNDDLPAPAAWACPWCTATRRRSGAVHAALLTAPHAGGAHHRHRLPPWPKPSGPAATKKASSRPKRAALGSPQILHGQVSSRWAGGRPLLLARNSGGSGPAGTARVVREQRVERPSWRSDQRVMGRQSWTTCASMAIRRPGRVCRAARPALGGACRRSDAWVPQRTPARAAAELAGPGHKAKQRAGRAALAGPPDRRHGLEATRGARLAPPMQRAHPAQRRDPLTGAEVRHNGPP